MDELDIKVNRMYRYYQAEKYSPIIKNLALRITQGETTRQGKVMRIANWIRNNIRYQREPPKFDITLSPTRLLNLGVGDCEDITLLTSTLCGVLGISTKWKVVSQDGLRWTHIYPSIAWNGVHKPMDLSAPVPLGTEVPYRKQRTYNLS